MWSHSGSHAKLVRDTEYYTALFELCVTATVYVATVTILAVKIRRTRERRAALKRYDIRILIQAMTISFFIGFVLFTWYSFDTYLIATKWTFFVVNIMWILNCGINPILYVLLNKTVRRKYIHFIKIYMLGNAAIADSDLAALCAASGITHRTYRLTHRSSSSLYRPQSWSIRSSQRRRQSNNNIGCRMVIYDSLDLHKTRSGGQ
ncbi:hypothetical protein Tcan_15186 [Toxocara canis]|nr:hypothetical protein Tcan_15186 [Toxocara canis]